MGIGIDYSMTCPAACRYSDSGTQFWYCHDSKWDVDLPGLHGVYLGEYSSVSKRAAFLAASLLKWVSAHVEKTVWIEDYAFAATGRVFHIGENTGILKHFLDDASIEYMTVPPTVVKKFATGKGNADKHKMTEAFLRDYPPAVAWITRFFPRYKEGQILAKSPLSDLADAYWIAKYAHSLER